MEERWKVSNGRPVEGSGRRRKASEGVGRRWKLRPAASPSRMRKHAPAARSSALANLVECDGRSVGGQWKASGRRWKVSGRPEEDRGRSAGGSWKAMEGRWKASGRSVEGSLLGARRLEAQRGEQVEARACGSEEEARMRWHLSGDQWRSVAISGNQWLSVHLERSVAISGYQWPSVAISGHQWPSVAISGHQWPSVAIRSHQKPPEATPPEATRSHP